MGEVRTKRAGFLAELIPHIDMRGLVRIIVIVSGGIGS